MVDHLRSYSPLLTRLNPGVHQTVVRNSLLIKRVQLIAGLIFTSKQGQTYDTLFMMTRV